MNIQTNSHLISFFKRTIWLTLSPIGVWMGLMAVNGYLNNAEWAVWLFLSLIVSLIIVRYVQSKWFMQSLLTGICWGIGNALIQFIFFDTYLQNNPQLVKAFGSVSNPSFFVLLFSTLYGILIGLIIGLWVLLFRKWEILAYGKELKKPE